MRQARTNTKSGKIPSDKPGPSEPSKSRKLQISHDHSYFSQKSPVTGTEVQIFSLGEKKKKLCMFTKKYSKEGHIKAYFKSERKNTVPNIQ